MCRINVALAIIRRSRCSVIIVRISHYSEENLQDHDQEINFNILNEDVMI